MPMPDTTGGKISDGVPTFTGTPSSVRPLYAFTLAMPVTAMRPVLLATKLPVAGLPLITNWIWLIGGAAEVGIVAVVVPPGTAPAPTDQAAVPSVPLAEPLS